MTALVERVVWVSLATSCLLYTSGKTQVGKTPQPNHMDFEGYTDKDGSQITQKRTFEAQHYNDIPIPTWFVGNTSESLIAYWKDVNDCLPTADPDSDYGQVYWQDKANSDACLLYTSFPFFRPGSEKRRRTAQGRPAARGEVQTEGESRDRVCLQAIWLRQAMGRKGEIGKENVSRETFLPNGLGNTDGEQDLSILILAVTAGIHPCRPH